MIYAVFAKFLFSSLSSSVLDVVMFTIFCKLFKNMESLPIGYIMLSTVLARIISAIYNFSINYKVVFKGSGNKIMAGIKYAVLAIIIVLLSGYGVTFIHGLIPSSPEFAVKIPVDCLLFLLSFLVQREIVYK